MNTKLKRVVFLMILMLTVFVSATELRLADNGQAFYSIVPPEKPTKMELLAVKDLHKYLNEITGAKFAIGNNATNKIYVGHRLPGKQSKLAEGEERIISRNGNIYIFGEGRYGNAFAVYEFLEHFFKCRWYSMWGDESIPKLSTVVLPKLNHRYIPTYPGTIIHGGSNWFNENLQAAKDFYRRNRIHAQGEGRYFIGPNYYHSASRFVPPGQMLGDKSQFTPLKYFKDKEYFKTNPEYFRMDKSGKRVYKNHHCYSNPGLRKTMTENILYVIKKEYTGGHGVVIVDLNDKRTTTLCHCKKCLKLAQGYGDGAGAYWDYILEFSRILKQKYPLLVIRTSAYEMTENAPPKLKYLPKNVELDIAPLNSNFIKPLTHYSNSKQTARIRKWAKLAKRLDLQIYPTFYLRPVNCFALVANIRRLVANLKFARSLGVTHIHGEIGYYPIGNMGFNELRMFILATLSRNLDQNINTLVKKFMNNYYGAAAPIMYKYYLELEKLELAESRKLSWYPDQRGVLSYLTPANLLRWENNFDKMESLVKNDTQRLLNVRRARTNLDEAVVQMWPKVSKKMGYDDKMLDAIVTRHAATVKADLDVCFASSLASEKWTKHFKQGRYENQCGNRAMRFFLAIAKGPKPLPAQFNKFSKKRIIQMLPHAGKLNKDPDSAYGIAVKAKLKKTAHFVMASKDPGGNEARIFNHFKKDLSIEEIKKSAGKYRFYYIGKAKVAPECELMARAFDGAGVLVGVCYDGNPNQQYDFYVSLKYEAPNTVWFDRIVAVKK